MNKETESIPQMDIIFKEIFDLKGQIEQIKKLMGRLVEEAIKRHYHTIATSGGIIAYNEEERAHIDKVTKQRIIDEHEEEKVAKAEEETKTK